jgi:hypothetical protein
MKLWGFPKTESSILKYVVPPLWPPYIGERRTPFSKAYGIKVRLYGEMGKHCENWGTCWKPIGNSKGT